MESLRKRIKRYIDNNGDWVHKGVISDLAREAHYSSENAGRRCRELEESGEIERKIINGCVHYRRVTKPLTPMYEPEKFRQDRRPVQSKGDNVEMPFSQLPMQYR
jgi:hypothetical protein